MLDKFLAKQQKDILMDRINKVEVVNKYNLFFSIAIISSFVTIAVGGISMLRFMQAPPPETIAVNLKEMTGEGLITLDFPHQSFKNVSRWVEEAAMDTYSFDFNNFDQNIADVSHYFTDEGYAAYLNSVLSSGLKEQIVDQKIKVSTVVTGNPVMLGGGTFGNIEFWRFETPIRVSFYGGQNPKPQEMVVNMLVVKMPTHLNNKGIGIAEFKMRSM